MKHDLNRKSVQFILHIEKFSPKCKINYRKLNVFRPYILINIPFTPNIYVCPSIFNQLTVIDLFFVLSRQKIKKKIVFNYDRPLSIVHIPPIEIWILRPPMTSIEQSNFNEKKNYNSLLWFVHTHIHASCSPFIC